MNDSRRSKLAAQVRNGEFILAPGVFDMVSARIADQMGFKALYVTGYGVVASYLGLPDAGLATFTDMVDRVGQIAEGTSTPIICDADTGYGGLLNVQRTVRGYEDAGAAAIQIEDQETPKKCGHTPDRRVIPVADMVQKIQVAIDARRDPDFLVVARTDARTGLGLDEALKRGAAYAEAGADVIFVESPESEDELERIGSAFDVPLLANMSDTGKTPILSAERLEALGFTVAIFPGTGLLAAAGALESVYGTLKRDGTTANVEVPLYPLERMHKLLGFEEVWAFEEKYGRIEIGT